MICVTFSLHYVTNFMALPKPPNQESRASEIGLRAIFHFGSGSVIFDHTMLAIGHNIVVAVIAPGVRTTRLASATLLSRVGDLLF